MAQIDLQDIIKWNPNKLSRSELDEYIAHCWSKIGARYQYGDIHAALLSERTARQNKVTVNVSLIFSILAVLFAFGSLFFSIMDWRGDKDWQSTQIEELQIQSLYLQEIAQATDHSPPEADLKAAPKK